MIVVAIIAPSIFGTYSNDCATQIRRLDCSYRYLGYATCRTRGLYHAGTKGTNQGHPLHSCQTAGTGKTRGQLFSSDFADIR